MVLKGLLLLFGDHRSTSSPKGLRNMTQKIKIHRFIFFTSLAIASAGAQSQITKVAICLDASGKTKELLTETPYG